MTAGLLDTRGSDGHKSSHRIWERQTNRVCRLSHPTAKDLPGGPLIRASENIKEARQGKTGHKTSNM